MASRLNNQYSQDRVATALSEEQIHIRIGQLEFTARWELKAAPRTCELFRRLLPLKMKMIHCSWSGEGGWIPLGGWDWPWHPENQTGRPKPGQLLLYAAGKSEPELLLPYGACVFNSRFGLLTGNHFLTISEGNVRLTELKQLLLWQGAQDCTFELP
jgi:hypothetical protein